MNWTELGYTLGRIFGLGALSEKIRDLRKTVKKLKNQRNQLQEAYDDRLDELAACRESNRILEQELRDCKVAKNRYRKMWLELATEPEDLPNNPYKGSGN